MNDSPVQVTLTFPTLAVAITALAQLRGGDNVATGAAIAGGALPAAGPQDTTVANDSALGNAQPEQQKRKPGRPPSAKTADEPSTARTSAAAGSAPNRDDLAKAISAKVLVDRAKVLETLTSFGYKAGKDIPDDRIGEFLIALDAAFATDGDDLT